MIRTANPADVPEILTMIRELADYERALEQAVATEEQLHEALFGPQPTIYAHMAVDDATGESVGFSLWYLTFSTWLGRNGIYLEDLYIRPDRRGGGHGRALLAELARIAVDRGYRRIEWQVLKWNGPSIGFYKSLGAFPQDEWSFYRLTGDALGELAAGN